MLRNKHISLGIEWIDSDRRCTVSLRSAQFELMKCTSFTLWFHPEESLAMGRKLRSFRLLFERALLGLEMSRTRQASSRRSVRLLEQRQEWVQQA